MNYIFDKIKITCENLDFKLNSQDEAFLYEIKENRKDNIILYKTKYIVKEKINKILGIKSNDNTPNGIIQNQDVFVGFFLDKNCNEDVKINISMVDIFTHKIVFKKSFFIKPGTFKYFFETTALITVGLYFTEIIVDVDTSDKNKDYLYCIKGEFDTQFRRNILGLDIASYFIYDCYYCTLNGSFLNYGKTPIFNRWIRNIQIPNLIYYIE